MVRPTHPTRVRLIDTMVEMLQTTPASAITTEAVLETSGISRSSLYHHFADFSDLIEAIGLFELERRGAQVTAMDLYTDGFFGQVRQALGSHAMYRQQDIYALTPAFGQFDLVVCGSLLLHLPDPLGAARALRAVCRGRAVVATYASDDPLIEGRPILEFLGQKATDGDYYTYWRMTPDALVAMLLVAGFARAEAVSRFQLEGRSGYSSPHAVVHAWV